MIHYHGTPITPKSELNQMAGRNFCVPFTDPRDADTCLRIGQSVMFDNGAYSAFTRNAEFDYRGYLDWVEPMLHHPHWCVVPDVIDGTVEDQHKMLSQWPRETIGYDHCAPVFHIHLPLSHLIFLCNAYTKVCLGSSGEYWKLGTDKWVRRMDEIFNALVNYYGRLPYLHGLRMLGQSRGGWPLASADSTNIAQNHHLKESAEILASKVDAKQRPVKWNPRATQTNLLL